MNYNILPFSPNSNDSRYRIYVSNHMLLHSQPERVQRDLTVICPDAAEAVLPTLLAGQKVVLREGRFEALNPLAIRLYSLGFQIELVPLD